MEANNLVLSPRQKTWGLRKFGKQKHFKYPGA